MDGKPWDQWTDEELAEGKVQIVKVIRAEGEELDVSEVIRRAPDFTFDSGTFTDTAVHYLTATTRDKRNGFQFSVSESQIKFQAALFFVGEP
jgi:hypothetical protein